MRRIPFLVMLATLIPLLSLSASCARTEIIESPKTTFVPDSAPAKEPVVIWTSRTLSKNFDYLGQIKTRSLTYQGALDRLVEAGRQLKADAVTDVHYEAVGFLTTMQAFAIKFKE